MGDDRGLGRRSITITSRFDKLKALRHSKGTIRSRCDKLKALRHSKGTSRCDKLKAEALEGHEERGGRWAS